MKPAAWAASLQDALDKKGLAPREGWPGTLDWADFTRLQRQLVEAGYLSEAVFAETMAEILGIDYLDLSNIDIDPALFERLPAREACKYKVIPCGQRDGALDVAMADPFDLATVDRLERLCACPIRPVLAGAAAIDEALKRSQGTGVVLDDLSASLVQGGAISLDDATAINIDYEDDEQTRIARLINTILIAALQKRASDIHIEAYARDMLIKYRIDGVLSPAMAPMSRAHHEALMSRLKVMTDMDIAERRTAQDARMKLTIEGREVDFRVSILPGVFGEDAVIRVLDKGYLSEAGSLSLSHLGYDDTTLLAFRKVIREPYGMVLITGPTGSGKTTTLYAALSELDHEQEKIITIEDPVEYQLNGIVQIPVNEKKGVTFVSGLRSVLRHDPDKIMIGEIRDSETVQIAVQSALTGHLVFTTVHANNALDVIGRFEHMGVNLYNFVSALNCVVAQRLIRTNCPHCSHKAKPDADTLSFSGIDAKAAAGFNWTAGNGCEHCNHTGYRGRTAVTEFLRITPEIRDAIIDRCSLSRLQELARAQGMVTLREAALDKVRQGLTTLQEINRVTFVE